MGKSPGLLETRHSAGRNRVLRHSLLMLLVIMLTAACEVEEADEAADADDPDEEVEPDEADPDDPDGDTDEDPIRIGYITPTTGDLAASGQDAVDGHELFWEQEGLEIAGRPVEIFVGDTQGDPDTGIDRARGLIDREGVHLLIGPLGGHVGPAVAAISEETGVPLLVDIAASDELTQRDPFDTVIRTGWNASQVSHPFGHYMYHELGCRNATFIGQDYTFGQENAMGAMAAFEEEGGEIAERHWVPLGTTDYGPFLGSIPDDTDCVIPMVVGADRLRLFEQMFDFGVDEAFDVHGLYLFQADIVPELDERAVGMISTSLNYIEGLDLPQNEEFVNAFAEANGRLPAHFAEGSYTASLVAARAIEEIDGDVEDSEAFLEAVRNLEVETPRGPFVLDEYDNPIQNVYIAEIQEVDHPVLGETLMNVPIHTYEEVSQFWTWEPDEYLDRPPYDTSHPLYTGE